ncbi:MAG: hypothetical protein IJ511_00435 [Bacteroides sp.]|nr:hypothetical protein [Bacteroides sp.]
MKRYLLLLGGILCLSLLQAQELKVVNFQRLERDLYARTHERVDLNDEPCGVLRVSLPNAKAFKFAGNIIGDVIYESGQALVYLTAGTRKIRISSDKFGSMSYEFPERIQKQVVYKLTLKLEVSEAKKTRTLVMPVVGIGEVTSYGLMVGIVKKWGGYAKVKYSFTGQATTLSCDKDGYLLDGTGEKLWFTGEKASSRLAITAGGMYRVILPLYLYAGIGYGYKKSAWEMADGNWAEADAHTSKGLEAEVGGIYRFKNFALSAGLQTNQFKYMEATVGIAVMF